MKAPVRVAVTGAAGQISYSLLFRIASGDMLGKDQPVILQLLEITPALEALNGVIMELEDCAFPLVAGITGTDDANVAFKDADYALLVGARPRGPGMERKDLLEANAAIFSAQGKAINDNASKGIKVLVVGNPANTNALIAQRNAPDIDPRQFTAMTRLDHNRAMAQLANKLGKTVNDVKKMLIWGNHSSTQYPDLHHCEVDGKVAIDQVEQDWYENDYIPTVQQRGAAIIKARGASSAASAANAAVDHMRSWALGTDEGDWVSMGIYSDGSYGIQEGLIYSFRAPAKTATGLSFRAWTSTTSPVARCKPLRKNWLKNVTLFLTCCRKVQVENKKRGSSEPLFLCRYAAYATGKTRSIFGIIHLLHLGLLCILRVVSHSDREQHAEVANHQQQNNHKRRFHTAGIADWRCAVLVAAFATALEQHHQAQYQVGNRHQHQQAQPAAGINIVETTHHIAPAHHHHTDKGYCGDQAHNHGTDANGTITGTHDARDNNSGGDTQHQIEKQRQAGGVHEIAHTTDTA